MILGCTMENDLECVLIIGIQHGRKVILDPAIEGVLSPTVTLQVVESGNERLVSSQQAGVVINPSLKNTILTTRKG